MSVFYACWALDWTHSKGALAYHLHEKGAVKTGRFEIKNKKLSPSPIYFNLRTKQHPREPGLLLDEDVKQIGKALFNEVFQEAVRSGLEFDFVAGIPDAGTPFAAAFRENLTNGGYYRAGLHKIGSGDSRRIENFYVVQPTWQGHKGKRVLIIDDVISGGDTKFEAIKAVEDAGYKVAGVVVLIDREQGGSEELEKRGYKVISVFKLSKLLLFYLATSRIFRNNFEEIMGYIDRSKKIIAASK